MQVSKAAVLVVAAVLSLASASATPYHEAVRASPLGGGRFTITAEVNHRTSTSAAVEYAFRYAGEVCRGRRFSVLADSGSRDSRDWVSYDAWTRRWSRERLDDGATVVLVVQCH